MIRHFFLDKASTITEDSSQNMGLNPILQIAYGQKIMRGVIHFDVEPIKCLIEDKTFANVDKLTFTLKMTNCFTLNDLPYDKTVIRGTNFNAKRATSFDLMLFKLPQHFDAGRGYDFLTDFWVGNNAMPSSEGVNWFNAKSNIPWFKKEYEVPVSYKGIEQLKTVVSGLSNCNTVEAHYTIVEKEHNGTAILSGNTGDGIYPIEYLIDEYNNYIEGKESIIVGTQHFDFGHENLSVDITDYVLDVINTNLNYGLGIAFVPRLETDRNNEINTVAFFTDNTNTFFHPYVEAKYDEIIMDDRESFAFGRENKLYLYAFDDNVPVNLDKLPSCSIDGVNFPVKQASKGVYFASVASSALSVEELTMCSDIWSDIELNGAQEDDVELEFTVLPKTKWLRLGSNSEKKNTLVPSLYGINDDERIHRGEIREVTVDFRQKYTTDKKELITQGDYRLYIKDGAREIDVIPYHPIEKNFLYNYFNIYAEDLIPNEYFVDIRVVSGREKLHYKNVLRFTVVSDVTERYQ